MSPQNPHTLDSAAFLQTKYNELEELSRRALEVREKVLGRNHRDILDNLYCFAYLLDHLRRYDEALHHY